MADTSFLPSLSTSDIEQVVYLIQQAYNPTRHIPPDELKRLQQQLFEMQKRPEAWGLVIPLLNHDEPNVQFFGAHTAQVKIARDWEAFPTDHMDNLRDLMVQLMAHSAAIGRPKFILRKLFVALTSLALKLVPGHPTRWPSWIHDTVSIWSSRGVNPEHILDFLSIIAEEVGNADLLGSSKSQMHQSMNDAIPMVSQAFTTTIAQKGSGAVSSSQFMAAIRCFQAWIPFLRANDITPLIPLLIDTLSPPFPSDISTTFPASSEALQDIMSKSPLSDSGAGSKTLTESLLVWFDAIGSRIFDEYMSSKANSQGGDDMEMEMAGVFHSMCKLLVGLGDHSTVWIAGNIASGMPVTVSLPSGSANGSVLHTTSAATTTTSTRNVTTTTTTKGHLAQRFLKLMLDYTGLPGYYGVDEEESEMTLGFWYLFQEALWSTDWYSADGDGEGEDDGAAGGNADVGSAPDFVVSGSGSLAFTTSGAGADGGEVNKDQQQPQIMLAKAVYSELVKILRRKVAFPGAGSGWAKDQVEKFGVYRRDVGDTLINAYYVLRDDMLGYYVNDIAERLAARQPQEGWQDSEATLHCIMSIHEAVDMEKAHHLQRLFHPSLWGLLPSTGRARIRRTALGVIGVYASWFATQSYPPPTSSLAHNPEHNLLLVSLSYVVSALADPPLSLSAATALRNLCEANRKELARHIEAFGQIHAGLDSIPDSEKSKVLESIASVIQAMPPTEGIPAIEAIVRPIVQKLYDDLATLAAAGGDPKVLEATQRSTILQLEILSGIAKGLTHTSDLGSDEVDPDLQAENEKIKAAREEPSAVQLREYIFTAIRGVVEVWPADAAVGQALSDLFKSITSLPSDITLITLPAGPLLELVCLAAQRQLTAAWLSLAAILIAQLNPPVFSLNMKGGPTQEAQLYVQRLLPILIQRGLETLSVQGAMQNNPDIVQEFFGCMDRTAQDFTTAFYSLPPGLVDALVQCAIRAISLQERYSLVAACNFLGTLIHRSAVLEELGTAKEAMLTLHGRGIMRAVLEGIAAIAPRSAVPNLVELLGTLLSRAGGTDSPGGGAVAWMKEALLADDFAPNKAGADARNKFIQSVAGSRSLKRTREAAQHFMLVARGLEGFNFGYSSLSM